MLNLTEKEKDLCRELSRAAYKGDVKEAQVILDSGADINNDFLPPIQQVCEFGNHGFNKDIAMIEFLVSKGADINKGRYAHETRGKCGFTPLMTAIRHEKTDVVRKLLELGADVNRSDEQWNSAIFWAMKRTSNNYELIKLLVEHGADLNVRDVYNHTTPLMGALADVTLLDLFIKNGADVNFPSTAGETALHCAKKQAWPNDEVIAMLRAAGAKDSETTRELTDLVKGIENNATFDKEQIGKLIADDADITGALRDSVLRGNTEVVTVLLGNITNTKESEKYKGMALSLAVKEGHADLIESLIKSGADVNTPDEKGMTPLMTAVSLNRVEVVKTLLENGADMKKEHNGKTVMDIAKDFNKADVLGVLTAWEEKESQNAQKQKGNMFARMFKGREAK